MYQQVKLQARLNSLWIQMQNTTGVQRKRDTELAHMFNISINRYTWLDYKKIIAFQLLYSHIQYLLRCNIWHKK